MYFVSNVIHANKHIKYVNCGLHVNFWDFFSVSFCFILKKIILGKICYFGLRSPSSNSKEPSWILESFPISSYNISTELFRLVDFLRMKNQLLEFWYILSSHLYKSFSKVKWLKGSVFIFSQRFQNLC